MDHMTAQEIVDEYEAAMSPRRPLLAEKYGLTEWQVRRFVTRAYKTAGFDRVPRLAVHTETKGPRKYLPPAAIKEKSPFKVNGLTDDEFNEICRRNVSTWIPSASSMGGWL